MRRDVLAPLDIDRGDEGVLTPVDVDDHGAANRTM